MVAETVDARSLPKVYLRAMEPEDLDVLYLVENDESVWSVSATNVPYSRCALANFIVNSTGDIFTDKQVRMMVEDASHEIVGIVDLMNFDPQHLRAELGIVIRKEWQGKGYAQAAVVHLMHYARRVIHLHQLYAVVSVENAACLSALQVCGFQSSAVLRDWLFDGEKYVDAYMLQRKL